jgi:hypothetical protein
MILVGYSDKITMVGYLDGRVDMFFKLDPVST